MLPPYPTFLLWQTRLHYPQQCTHYWLFGWLLSHVCNRAALIGWWNQLVNRKLVGNYFDSGLSVEEQFWKNKTKQTIRICWGFFLGQQINEFPKLACCNSVQNTKIQSIQQQIVKNTLTIYISHLTGLCVIDLGSVLQCMVPKGNLSTPSLQASWSHRASTISWPNCIISNLLMYCEPPPTPPKKKTNTVLMYLRKKKIK